MYLLFPGVWQFLESLASEAGNADLESTLTAAPVSSTALGSITGESYSVNPLTQIHTFAFSVGGKWLTCKKKGFLAVALLKT